MIDMIKIWTWRPLEVECHYAKDIDAAVDYIQTQLDKYQAMLDSATDKWNERIRIANDNTRSEVMKQCERGYTDIHISEIMDMFTIFDCSINTRIQELRRNRNAITKSHN